MVMSTLKRRLPFDYFLPRMQIRRNKYEMKCDMFILLSINRHDRDACFSFFSFQRPMCPLFVNI